MSLRRRLVKEISRFLAPLVCQGGCLQQSGKAFNIVTSTIMPIPTAQKQIANFSQVRRFYEDRFSTMADVSRQPVPEIDLLSFIKASLDESDGSYHCWLNRSEKNEKPPWGGRIFLVLATSIFDHDIMLEKLKTIQKRFPHLFAMGIQSIHSSADQMHLIQLVVTENITVPILLSQRTFPEIEKGACYILFKNFSKPVIYPEKDLDLEILYQAIQELDMQPNDDAKLLNVLRRPSWKRNGITKDHYVCLPLQNLLLYYPGCVSADESADHLFFSDCNHHRIIVSNGNGEILDCIGSSPGFEDGDFESAKLRRPAGSYYHATENCLYFVDSENHAIRKADMGARLVETLYPTSTSDKRGVSIWKWIVSKLGLESSVETNDEEGSEVFDSKSLYFPWHLLKSVDDTIFIIDRRFQTLWTMDFSSGKIGEVFKGAPGILEICGPQILKNLSFSDQIPCDWFPLQANNGHLLESVPYSDLLSSVATLQNHIFICDMVGQRILKVNRESGVCSNFQLSNLGILGLPYWMSSPLEIFYAVGNGLSVTPIDHQHHFDLLPGRIDIKLSVDVPVDIQLVEPLQESCIWRHARGAATEVSGMDDLPGSLDKVGVAQQWYDELDDLASPKAELETAVELDNLDKNLVVEDEKVCIRCSVLTSPGTSEVIVYALLYLKLRRDPNSHEANWEKHAARLIDILSSGRCGKTERDLWKAFLLQSKGDLRDLIFMKALHIRIRINCADHPKAENGRDIILTDSSVEVNVLFS